MKLVELLHLCLISSRTGLITYSRESHSGKMLIRNGQVYHAEFQNMEGDEACYLMLETDSGNADFAELLADHEQTVTKSSEFLMMEAARRADEKSKTRKLPLPPPTQPPQVSLNALSTLKSPRLFIYDKDGYAQELAMTPPKTNLGRAPHNDICVPADSVSSLHCLFEVKGQKVFVTDLHSLNGTFINGQRIIEPAELMEGDTLHAGAIAMRFYWQKEPGNTQRIPLS